MLAQDARVTCAGVWRIAALMRNGVNDREKLEFALCTWNSRNLREKPAEGMSGGADVLVEISWRADFPSGGEVESVRCIGRLAGIWPGRRPPAGSTGHQFGFS